METLWMRGYSCEGNSLVFDAFRIFMEFFFFLISWAATPRPSYSGSDWTHHYAARLAAEVEMHLCRGEKGRREGGMEWGIEKRKQRRGRMKGGRLISEVIRHNIIARALCIADMTHLHNYHLHRRPCYRAGRCRPDERQPLNCLRALPMCVCVCLGILYTWLCVWLCVFKILHYGNVKKWCMLLSSQS